MAASAGWWGAENLSVGGDPVGGDHVLGGGEGNAVCAEQIVQCAFEFVLGVRGGSRLGPEVLRTVGSTPQLEGHQVVKFVRRGPVALPVGGSNQRTEVNVLPDPVGRTSCPARLSPRLAASASSFSHAWTWCG